MQVEVRRARTADVRAIRALVDMYTADRRLLNKATVTLYEQVQDFWVAVRAEDDRVVGCGALHVMWEDLAEIRTVAVDPACRGHKIGHRIVSELLGVGRELGVARVFCLTFETSFFGSFGFKPDRRRRRAARRLRAVAADRTTKVWPSSSILRGSSRTRWATRECCCTYGGSRRSTAAPTRSAC